MLERRKECATDQTHVCRDHHSITVTFLGNTLVSLLLQLQCWLKSLSYILSFHWVLSAMTMSTGRCHALPLFLAFFIISPF